jgi:hypothetical protein
MVINTHFQIVAAAEMAGFETLPLLQKASAAKRVQIYNRDILSLGFALN